MTYDRSKVVGRSVVPRQQKEAQEMTSLRAVLLVAAVACGAEAASLCSGVGGCKSRKRILFLGSVASFIILLFSVRIIS